MIIVYSSSGGDPFEFHSQDNEGEILSRTRTPPPPPPPNQQYTNTEPKETNMELKEQHKQNNVQDDNIIMDVSNKSDEIVSVDEEAVSSVPMHVVDKSSDSTVNADSTRSSNVTASVQNQTMNQSNAVNTDSNRSEVCNEITPSEHGQVVDRSSEDPLNSDDVRSEMASSIVSSPR